MTTIKLSKPIEAHGEKVAELTFREPTGRDLRDCGSLFVVAGSDPKRMKSAMDMEAAARYIVALAGIPSSAVDKLSAPDFQRAANAVAGFFADAQTQASS